MDLGRIKGGMAELIWQVAWDSRPRRGLRSGWPPAIPPAAVQAADDLIALYESVNGRSMADLFRGAQAAGFSKSEHLFGSVLVESALNMGTMTSIRTSMVIPYFQLAFDGEHLKWDGRAKTSADEDDESIHIPRRARRRQRRNPQHIPIAHIRELDENPRGTLTARGEQMWKLPAATLKQRVSAMSTAELMFVARELAKKTDQASDKACTAVLDELQSRVAGRSFDDFVAEIYA